MLSERLFVTTSGTPLPPSGPPTLSLHALLTAARIAFTDPSLDVDDIESMCASLMDQVRGIYLTGRKGLMWERAGVRQGVHPSFEEAAGAAEGSAGRVSEGVVCESMNDGRRAELKERESESRDPEQAQRADNLPAPTTRVHSTSSLKLAPRVDRRHAKRQVLDRKSVV